ncbi:hypothetical protein PMAYCL1PPCAC_00837, partial [Pristionchus mayeri]
DCALVSFPYSQVYQAPDITGTNKANFKCKNTCKVYVDGPTADIIVTKNGQTIVTFNIIASANGGFELAASDEYMIENRGEPNRDFVFYVVDSKAPNYGSPVFAPQVMLGIAFKGSSRYATFLSSFEAIEFSSFAGTYPDGYPRIYATGFDAAGDERCQPVYQARSQYNAEKSWPTIPTALLTVDFGFEGAHTVSANPVKAADPMKATGVTTVYTSPGYVGCSFNNGQNYHSTVSQVIEQFTLAADRLDVETVYDLKSNVEGIQFNVNDKKNLFVGTNSYSEHYSKDTFAVLLSWYKIAAGSSWAMQLDFGTDVDPPIITTTKIGSSLSVLPTLSVVIVQALLR